MKYVSTGDLIVRWNYTRQGVNVLMKQPDFPKPVARVSRGKLPIWELTQIMEYEIGHPELHDAIAKTAKRLGFGKNLN